MRIFIKNLSLKGLNLISRYPIQGVIFTIEQNNAETVREMIKRIPFYITIIGEVQPFSKYEIEELIFFCNLKGIIIRSSDYTQQLSCPHINIPENLKYNILLHKNNKYSFKKIDINNLSVLQEEIVALVVSEDEFIRLWPSIIKFWLNN